MTCEHGGPAWSDRIRRRPSPCWPTASGKQLNSPNDVVVKSDGSIWFTDPPFGLFGYYEGEKLEQELPANVYRVDGQTGAITVAADDVQGPNGLAFSPDELLDVVELRAMPTRKLRVFDVNGETLGASKMFLDAGVGTPMGSASPTPSGSSTTPRWSSASWRSRSTGSAARPFRRARESPGPVGVLNMLGMFAYFRGEWDKALELYKRAQATVSRTGNVVMDAIYVLNIGEIELDQGRLEEAEQRFEYSSRVFRAARYRTGMAYLSINLARLAARQGRFSDALRIFEESMAERVTWRA